MRSRRTPTPSPEELAAKARNRMWRASLYRAKADRLGIVYAADRETAERVAIEEFHLNDEQRMRLVVVER